MVRHYSLTLDGSAQQLSDVLANTEVGGPDDVPLLEVCLEIQDDDTNPIYVGGDNTVSVTDYGTRVPPIAAAEPLVVPRVFQGVKLHLSDFWVIGTAADVLHVLVVRQ